MLGMVAPDIAAETGDVAAFLSDGCGPRGQEAIAHDHPAIVEELLGLRQRSVGNDLHRRHDQDPVPLAVKLDRRPSSEAVPLEHVEGQPVAIE